MSVEKRLEIVNDSLHQRCTRHHRRNKASHPIERRGTPVNIIILVLPGGGEMGRTKTRFRRRQKLAGDGSIAIEGRRRDAGNKYPRRKGGKTHTQTHTHRWREKYLGRDSFSNARHVARFSADGIYRAVCGSSDSSTGLACYWFLHELFSQPTSL